MATIAKKAGVALKQVNRLRRGLGRLRPVPTAGAVVADPQTLAKELRARGLT